MKKVVCLGDSITYGHVGVSYFEMLKTEFRDKAIFINKGINGNLSYDVLKRLDEVIAQQPDCVILLIGTNDVWATHSEKVSKAYVRKNKLPEIPSKEGYEKNLAKILQRLKSETRAVIGVMSLPLITENPEHILFKRTVEYSELIKKICQELDVFYIPVNEYQREYLRTKGATARISQDVSWSFTGRMIFEHFLFRKSWDVLSKKNGFLLTVDHVHQNSTGARLIKDCAAKFLKDFLLE